MGNSTIKLELTKDEINKILLTLAEFPYKDVFELISKIREQAQPQVNE